MSVESLTPAPWLERQQIWLYLAALALGAAVGLTVPGVSAPSHAAVQPILAVLLYATFLGLPFTRLGEALRDGRFLAALAVLNFVLVPLVVWGLSRFLVGEHVLLVGVLFVLLTPCIDYVMVFARMAGADHHRLVVAAPMLMLAQMLLLPVYLTLFLGTDFAATIDPAPFLQALMFIIVAPLLAAVGTQLLGRRVRVLQNWAKLIEATMVPLMMLTLMVVVMSQIHAVSAELAALVTVIPVFCAFAVIMAPVGNGLGRAFKVDVAGRRSLVFSGVTRNSLVILPLVLALPAGYELAPLVVVTQTLVELCLMVLLTAVVPKLVRAHPYP